MGGITAPVIVVRLVARVDRTRLETGLVRCSWLAGEPSPLGAWRAEDPPSPWGQPMSAVHPGPVGNPDGDLPAVLVRVTARPVRLQV